MKAQQKPIDVWLVDDGAIPDWLVPHIEKDEHSDEYGFVRDFIVFTDADGALKLAESDEHVVLNEEGGPRLISLYQFKRQYNCVVE